MADDYQRGVGRLHIEASNMSELDNANRTSFRDLGVALDRDAGQLNKWSKKPGWPKDNNIEQVKIWIHRNIRAKKRDADPSASRGKDRPISAPTPDAAQAVPGVHVETITSNDPLVKEMAEEGASPLTLLRVAMRMAGRRAAIAYQKGELSPGDLDALKKTSQELRNAEMGYIELEKERGELIERDVVEELVGSMVARLIRCCGILENSLATEVSLWLAPDSDVAKMSQDDRARAIREFVAKTCKEIRTMESDGVDSLISSQIELSKE